MPLRTFALVPRRPSMLPKGRGRGGISAARDLESLGFLVFLPQSGQHALRSKRSFAQSDAHSVINGVGDGGNSRGQGTFAGFFGPKWTFRINALYDDALD